MAEVSTSGWAMPLTSRQASTASLRSRLGCTLNIGASLVLLAMTPAPPAAAQYGHQRGPGPDMDDLAYHIACSEAAKSRIQTSDEAAGCARAFLRVELSFIPGIGLHEFASLPPEQRATVNLAGYRLYLDWIRENARQVESLRNALLPPPSVTSH